MKCGAADNYTYEKNKRYYFQCDFADFFLIYTFYKQIDFIEKYNINQQYKIKAQACDYA